MITLTIPHPETGDEIEYKAPQFWDEMTLGKFIDLCNIEIPEKLRNLWVASAVEDMDDPANAEEWKKADDVIGIIENEKTFPEYYGKVMALLTDIPKAVIDLIHGTTRAQFFDTHLRHFIYSSFARYPVHIVDGKLEMYDPAPSESFELDGVKYMMPETLYVYGDEIPLGREQAITFTEASDIEVALRNMAEGAADRLPMFVAIYCRPEGEAYDEIKTMERAKRFNDLPMSEVWRVFFCISKRLTRFQKYTQEYSSELLEKATAKLASQV